MHILNIIQCTNLGGMEQASLRLMQALTKRGHACHVLSLNPLGALMPLLAEANISAEGLAYEGSGGWRSFPSLAFRLRFQSADAIIMTGHSLGAMLALGCLASGHRLLALHSHHSGVKRRWHWRVIYQIATTRFQAVTFPSDFIRNEAEAIYPPLRRLARTLRNPLLAGPVATAEDRLRLRASLGAPPDSILIGNAGWLIRRKRFDVFLDTAARIAAGLPQAYFLIAGDGPERERLQLQAQELKLGDRLLWLGWVTDMRRFYQGLDVLLFNADWDAFPTTPLEAMSYGVPVVASVVHGGLGEVITDDRFGVLFRTHDVPRLAEAVVAASGAGGRAMGMRGRELVAALSAPDVIAREVERILMGEAT